MIKRTRVGLLFVALVIIVSGAHAVREAAAASPWVALTQTTTCQNVSTTAVEMLAENTSRYRWTIWTTSGAPTIYFREDGTAVANAAASGPLTGGNSYTEDYASTTGAVSAITASGTAWVCAKEGVGQ